MIKKLIIISTLILVFCTKIVNATEAPKVVAVNKIWTVCFSKTVDISTINEQNIKIINADNQEIPHTIDISQDKKSISINPPSNKYINGREYRLIIKGSIKDNYGRTLMKDTTIKFSIVKAVDPALIETSSSLQLVYGMVSTENERNLIKVLKKEIDGKIENLDKSTDIGSLKQQYYALSDTEKTDFKKCIYNIFTIGTLIKIKEIFQ